MLESFFSSSLKSYDFSYNYYNELQIMKHFLDSNFNLTLYFLSNEAQLLILRYFIAIPLDNPGKYNVRHAWLDRNCII